MGASLNFNFNWFSLIRIQIISLRGEAEPLAGSRAKSWFCLPFVLRPNGANLLATWGRAQQKAEINLLIDQQSNQNLIMNERHQFIGGANLSESLKNEGLNDKWMITSSVCFFSKEITRPNNGFASFPQKRCNTFLKKRKLNAIAGVWGQSPQHFCFFS